jgi:hypothetical protein
MNCIDFIETYTVRGKPPTVGSGFGGYKGRDITGDTKVDGSDSVAVLMNYIDVVETYTVNGQPLTVGSSANITIK